MKYIWIFILFVFLGCGGGTSSNVKFDTTVKLSEEDETIDIEKAKKSILSQLQEGENVELFVLPDQKDIFALVNHRFQTTLYDYDTTIYPPVKRGIIAEYPDNKIIDVIPLKNGKIIYQQEVPAYVTYIHIYDYILKKSIARYAIHYDFRTGEEEQRKRKIHMSTTLDRFTVADITIDINDLYNETPYQDRKIYRSDVQSIVIDEINNLMWQDDESVMNRDFSLQEAIRYCARKEPQNSWHIPTTKDIHKLMTQEEKLFSLFHFQSDNDDYTSFWIVNNPKRDEYGSYAISSVNFITSDKYIDISLGEEFSVLSSQKAHVRCVADIDKKSISENQITSETQQAVKDIQTQLGSCYKDIYVTKDPKVIFGICSENYPQKKETLFYYGINADNSATVYDEIAIKNDESLVSLYPLSNHKVLYQTIEKEQKHTHIYMYDYQKKEELTRYSFVYEDDFTMILAKDESSFFLENTKVDILSLVKSSRDTNMLEYIWQEDVVYDYGFDITWQDDSSVTTQTFTYAEAEEVCKNKGMGWHIPSIDDINKLISNLPNPFVAFFNNVAMGTYWLDNSQIISQENMYYYFVNKYAHYEMFMFRKKDLNKKMYVRCMRDF